MAAVRKSVSAVPAAEAEPTPEFEVVADQLVCHSFDGLRLPLVIPMPVVERWMQINAEAKTWQKQLEGWRAEVIPAEVLATIQAAAEGDGMREIELLRRWSWGLDVRLGKALS